MNTIAELRALDSSKLVDGRNVYVSGYYAANDGGGGIFVKDSDSTAVDDGGSVIETDTGTGRYLATFDGAVNIRRFGAKGDGTTNDRAAIQTAIDYGAANSIPVYIPPGRFFVSTAVFVRSRTVLFGAGVDSVLTSTHNNNGHSESCVIKTPYIRVSNTWLDDVVLKDFSIEFDDWTSYDNSIIFDTALFLRHVNRPVVENVTVRWCQGFSIILQYCRYARVNNCTVEYSGRDGIGVWGTDGADVSHNRVFCCGDNGIACHSLNDAPDMGIEQARNYVISCNRLVSTYGISCVGITESVISSNVLQFSTQIGIGVGYDSSLGENARISVVIANNSIVDTLNRTYMDNAAGGGNAITVNSPALSGGSSYSDPPGYADDTGAIVPIYGNIRNTGSTVQAGNLFLNINGNVISRRSSIGDVFSDVAGCSYLGYSGTNITLSDPTLTENMLGTCRGIEVVESLRKSAIVGNVISGCQFGIFFFGGTSGSFNDILIQSNQFIDFHGGGGVWIHEGYGQCGLVVKSNFFDGDPYFLATDRNADGTWDSSLGYPVAIRMSTATITGVTFTDNIIKNVYAPEARGSNPIPTLERNKLICQPAVVNYHATNKGIGTCPGGDSYIYEYMDCDPTSATYGTTLNYCDTGLRITPPTTGWYMRGHFVKNIGTSEAGGAGSKYVLLGWMKVTTGTNNVDGVDWVPCRALTGA